MPTEDFIIDWKAFRAELKTAMQKAEKSHFYAHGNRVSGRWVPLTQVLQTFLSWAAHHGCGHVYGDYCVLVFPIKRITRKDKTDGK
jgi:hypothetical protein